MEESRIEKSIIKLYNMNEYEILKQDLENHIIVAKDEDDLVFTKWYWSEKELPVPDWTRQEFEAYALKFLIENANEYTDIRFRPDVVNVAVLAADRAAMQHIVNYTFE